MDLFSDEPDFQDGQGDLMPSGTAETMPPLFQHPRSMSFCRGHELPERRLLEMLGGGRLPHGLIFAGPKGIGKATMAYRLARFLLKHGAASAPALDVDPADPVWRRVASGGHADLLSIEPVYDPVKNRPRESIDVEEIRKVPSFLRMTASEGGWRVVIVDDADSMNRNAQNALLKILEEPPARVLIVLVAHRPGALISTIRSRMQVLAFEALPPAAVQELLELGGARPEPSEAEFLTEFCAGSFGRALQMARDGGLAALDRMLAAFNGYPRWDWPALHALADDLGGAGREAEMKMFQEIVRWIFARIAGVKARGETPRGLLQAHAGLNRILRERSLPDILEIAGSLDRHFIRAAAANLDRRQTVLGAFMLIPER